MGNKNLNLAKALRKNSTEAERLLWKHLRDRQFENIKFKRQVPIADYVVDFVSFEKSIIIEVDGGQHAIEEDKDKLRDKRLNEEGFKILRFWNNKVLENVEGVLESIKEVL